MARGHSCRDATCNRKPVRRSRKRSMTFFSAEAGPARSRPLRPRQGPVSSAPRRRSGYPSSGRRRRDVLALAPARGGTTISARSDARPLVARRSGHRGLTPSSRPRGARRPSGASPGHVVLRRRRRRARPGAFCPVSRADLLHVPVRSCARDAEVVVRQQDEDPRKRNAARKASVLKSLSCRRCMKNAATREAFIVAMSERDDDVGRAEVVVRDLDRREGEADERREDPDVEPVLRRCARERSVVVVVSSCAWLSVGGHGHSGFPTR